MAIETKVPLQKTSEPLSGNQRLSMQKTTNESRMNTTEIDELVSGCINGDKRCQRAVFKKYRETVFFIISNALGPQFDRDDIFQQVFIKVFKSLTSFKGLSSLDTWVYRIASKVCIDQLRKKYRKRQINVVQNPDLIENRHDVSKKNPLDESEHRELSRQIYNSLNKLSVEKRIVISMFEMEGFSLQEISEIINKPIGTIKSRLFHGRKELAQHLRTYMDL